MYRARIVRIALFLLLGTTLMAQRGVSPASSAADILPFKPTEKTLVNGLKLIIVPTGFPNIVSLQIPVQTGSRNEVEPGKSGFAHFFEHLMFRGTPTSPPEKYREIMVKAGARDNASTGDDFTRYYATFAKEDLETMLRLYADMFQHLSYAEADFKTEARAVLGEYNKNSANPLQKLFETQRDTAFTTHTYKHTTMGFVKDIEDMPNQYAYSKVFFERWYRPQFTTLIVAGDVEPNEVTRLVEKHWGGWKGGSAAVDVPQEPAPKGRLYAHVPWSTETLPWVSVGFRSPGFSETDKDYAALDMVASLYFGNTSDLYKRLVVTEQKVDELSADNPASVDPQLFTVLARVKKPEDTPYVLTEILKATADARARPVSSTRLGDAKSHERYAFVRTLDSTERIAAVISGYAPYRRSYDTINNVYRRYDSLTQADLQAAARKYFADASMIVTTLSKSELPSVVRSLPAVESLEQQVAPTSTAATSTAAPAVRSTAAAVSSVATTTWPVVLQKTPLPLIDIKLLFNVGSADDPPGKEGLAALSAAMIANAGSKAMTIEAIDAALYPIAASFVARTDKEMTTFTGLVHRDQWKPFLDIALPQLVDPGFREQDFARLKARQINALVQDLRSNNEEELGKERLQTNLFRGTPYGHPALGSVAGLNAITLDDVKAFVQRAYTRGHLTVGLNGDVPDELQARLQASCVMLPSGAAAPARQIRGVRPSGIEVDLIEKDTRATAISVGYPIDVLRGHPDYAALSVARAWLGEHRASSGRLFQRIREVRGMNYGNYAYIEAFPRGMFQFFPDPNVARRAQIFEIWIRPVEPVNAHMALRVAIHELESLIKNGLSKQAFEQTRDYLLKNVYVMTARQDQQLGYALDSRFYRIGEFTSYMRDALKTLTPDSVNAAVRKHLSSTDLSVVIITKDAAALKDKLVADAFSPIKYDGDKPKALMDEDQVIGARRLRIDAAKVRITPVADVFGS